MLQHTVNSPGFLKSLQLVFFYQKGVGLLLIEVLIHAGADLLDHLSPSYGKRSEFSPDFLCSFFLLRKVKKSEILLSTHI